MATKAADDQVKKPLIFTTSDIKGNVVICATSTWNSHIERRHPEMRGRESDVQDAVSAPDAVFKSSVSPTALIHEKVTTDFVQIRVVTTYDHIAGFENGTTIAKVNTAYPVDAVLYDKPQIGSPVYQKPRNRPAGD
jgi:hypothetical protein